MDINALNTTQYPVTSNAPLATAQSTKPRANFLIQISQLVAEILTALNQGRSFNSQQIETEKQKYQGHSNKLWYNHVFKGGTSLASAVTCIIAAGKSYPNVPVLLNLGKEALFSFSDAYANEAGQGNQLILQKLQKLHDNSTSDDSLRNQTLGIIQKVEDWQKAAIARG